MNHAHVLKIFRLAGMGLLLWLVPFAASLGLYDRAGRLTVSYDLFRSVIAVSFSSFTSSALVRCHNSLSVNFLREGSLTGIMLCCLS